MKEFKEDKPWSNWFGYLAIFAIAAFFIIRAVDTPTPGEIVEARIVGLDTGPHENPRPVLLVVELANGSRVTLQRSEGALRKMGATVRIQKLERKIGSTQFRFVSFVDE